MLTLGLCCSMVFDLVEVSGGYCLVTVHGLLIATASPVAEHRLYVCGLSSCGHGGLAPPEPVKASQASKGNCVPCIGRWILNPWSTREV